MLSCVGPRSFIAISKHRAVISAIRDGLLTWPWYFVIVSNIGSWSASWNPPRPLVRVPASGVIATTGECAQYAAATPVTKFVIPKRFYRNYNKLIIVGILITMTHGERKHIPIRFQAW